MLEQDWQARNIETLTLSLAKFVFGKEGTEFTSEENAWDALALQTDALLGRGEYNAAEDLLFDAMEEGDDRALELAVAFYARLNERTDVQLKEGAFSRAEIEEGLREAMDRYGVVLP